MPVVNEKCDITELLICLVIKVMIHYLCFGDILNRLNKMLPKETSQFIIFFPVHILIHFFKLIKNATGNIKPVVHLKLLPGGK